MSTTARRIAVARKSLPFSVKSVDAEARTFEGIAAAYTLDLGGDVIHPGAFKDTLSFWRGKGFAVPLLDQHSYRSAVHDVMGSMVEAEEREDGLWSRFEVDEGPDGAKLLRHIKMQRINGLSIGYEPVNPERDEKGVRHLKTIKLREVSVVLWPMNPDAVFDPSSVKSWAEMSEEDLEAAKADLQREIDRRKATADEVPTGLDVDDPARIAAEAKLYAVTILLATV